MSKSKGIVMDPLDLIDKFGADAVRFTHGWPCTAQGRDIKLGREHAFEGYRNFIDQALECGPLYAEMNECSLDAARV